MIIVSFCVIIQLGLSREQMHREITLFHLSNRGNKKNKKQDAGECARNVFFALRALQQIFFFAFYSWSLRLYGRGGGGAGREWNKEIESWMKPLAGDLGFVDIPAAYQ